MVLSKIISMKYKILIIKFLVLFFFIGCNLEKGREVLIHKKKWLKNNPTASLVDHAAVENIIEDFIDALSK